MLNDLNAGKFYESETSQFLGAVLGAGDTFIDVGAHVGYFSMLGAALVGPTWPRHLVRAGRVELRAPARAHRAETRRRTCCRSARRRRQARVAEFFVNADNDGGHGLWAVGTHPFNARTRQAPRSRKVFLTTLDEFFGTQRVASREGDQDRCGRVGVRDLVGRATSARSACRAVHRRRDQPLRVDAMDTSEDALRGFMTILGYETYLFQPGHSFCSGFCRTKRRRRTTSSTSCSAILSRRRSPNEGRHSERAKRVEESRSSRQRALYRYESRFLDCGPAGLRSE